MPCRSGIAVGREEGEEAEGPSEECVWVCVCVCMCVCVCVCVFACVCMCVWGEREVRTTHTPTNQC